MTTRYVCGNLAGEWQLGKCVANRHVCSTSAKVWQLGMCVTTWHVCDSLACVWQLGMCGEMFGGKKHSMISCTASLGIAIKTQRGKNDRRIFYRNQKEISILNFNVKSFAVVTLQFNRRHHEAAITVCKRIGRKTCS